MGTVLDADTCRAAIAAGAEFVVTPICRTELVAIAHAAGCPIMLGAYTPTEAQLAHEAGADFIKIFPADTLGPGYIKALRAPLPHLRIVPTGGVDVQNVGRLPQGRVRRAGRRLVAGLRQNPPGSRLAGADPPRQCVCQRRPPGARWLNPALISIRRYQGNDLPLKAPVDAEVFLVQREDLAIPFSSDIRTDRRTYANCMNLIMTYLSSR